ncbi:MAG: P63C domain-containing protein, partial [Bryobacteraceae bacterium]
MADEKTPADFGAEGGKARAEALSKDQRSNIARQAAESRWAAEGKLLPKATHEGRLPMGKLHLPVAVLDGGIRVLTSSAVLQALGRPYKGNYKRTKLPNFLEAPNLYSFIGKELLDVLSPIQYVGLPGRRVWGYRAEILPLVCDVYLSARADKKLVPRQEPIARQAEILVRSLSKVGIVALIDEATGFQDVRDRLALQAILDKYLQKEFAAWAKRFPDEFYQQIFRLRGWEWRGMKINRPGVVASYTK